MADDRERAEAAKKKLAEEREERQKALRESEERMSKAKPTPTQEENDLAALGHPVAEKEDDGSGPDPHALQRSMHASAPSGGYQTRQAVGPRPPVPPKREG